MFKAKGRIQYDIKNPHSTFTFWNAALIVPSSIIRYYQYWVRRELKIRLNTPLWKAHVTVMRQEKPKQNTYLWKKYEGKEISFEYSCEMKNGHVSREDPISGENIEFDYFWLPAYSKDLEEIRMELGLRATPRVPFHITVGNTKKIEQVNIPEKKVTYVTFPWET